jgi:putative transcription factor
MADEGWDSVTKIGSKVRGGPSAPKEKVLRGESALNAARRTGSAVVTEKKFTAANQVNDPPCHSDHPTLRRKGASRLTVQSQKGGAEGQHLTKVDRSEDIVKPKTVGSAVGDAIKKARAEAKNDKGAPMTQRDLAAKINQTPTVLADFERGSAAPNEKILSDLERVLKVHLRGKNVGEPKVFGKKKQQAAQ